MQHRDYSLYVCLTLPQVAAMHAGVGGLIQLGPETMQRVTAVIQRGGGGASVHRFWGQGELEFEAYMRMLDSKVSTSWSGLHADVVWECTMYGSRQICATLHM